MTFKSEMIGLKFYLAPSDTFKRNDIYSNAILTIHICLWYGLKSSYTGFLIDKLKSFDGEALSKRGDKWKKSDCGQIAVVFLLYC
jgi:hypothetical protein